MSERAERLAEELVEGLEEDIEEPGYYLCEHRAVAEGSFAEDDVAVRKKPRKGTNAKFALSLALAVRAEIGLPQRRQVNRDMVGRILAKMCKELNVRQCDAVHAVAVATELVFTPTSSDVLAAQLGASGAMCDRRDEYGARYQRRRGALWRAMRAIGLVAEELPPRWAE